METETEPSSPLPPPPPPPPRDLLKTPESEIFEDTYIQLQEIENNNNEGFSSLVKSLDKINFTIRSFSRENVNTSIYKKLLVFLFFGGILVLNDYILLKHFV